MPITTPPIFATGDTIEASWANDLRSNDVTLDGRTGGVPGGASKWLVSGASETSSAWVARATEVLNAIGYTPLNKAGDSMSGNLGFTDTQEGVVFSENSWIRDDNAANDWQFFAGQDKITFRRLSNSAIFATFTNTLITLIATTLTGALNGTTAAFSGAITGASLTTSGGASIGGSVTASSGTGTFNAVTASTTVTGGTDVVKGVTSLGRIAKSSYSGNNVDGRQIVTGWAPRKVEIYVKTGSTLYAVAHVYSTSTNTTIIHAFNGASSFVSVSENTVLSASNGFLVDASGQNALNVSGNTYNYIAYE